MSGDEVAGLSASAAKLRAAFDALQQDLLAKRGGQAEV
jgi:hypothetical protein